MGLLEVMVAGAIMTITVLTMFGSMNYMARSQKGMSQITALDAIAGGISRVLNDPIRCRDAFKDAGGSAVRLVVPEIPWSAAPQTVNIPEISVGSGAGAQILARPGAAQGGLNISLLRFVNPVAGQPQQVCPEGTCNVYPATLFMEGQFQTTDGTLGAKSKRYRWAVTIVANSVAPFRISSCSGTGGGTGTVTGSGTIGRVTRWASASGALEDTSIFQANPATTGRVGIGTITPAAPLDVRFDGPTGGVAGFAVAQITNQAGAADGFANLWFKSDTPELGWISKNPSGAATYGGAGSFNLGTTGPENLTLVTSNASRVWVDPAGHVGIGTATPGSMLSIAAEGYSDPVNYGKGLQITTGVASGQLAAFVRQGVAAISMGYLPGGGTMFGFGGGIVADASFIPNLLNFDWTTGNVGIGNLVSATERLHVMGNALITGTITGVAPPFSTSDSRLKTNISPLEGSLEKILELEGVSFDWRRDKMASRKVPEGRDIGLIAQDVEGQFPEAVVTDKDGFKSVSHGKLLAPIIEAIKELWARFSSRMTVLESEVAELRRENRGLKAYVCSQKNAPAFCR